MVLTVKQAVTQMAELQKGLVRQFIRVTEFESPKLAGRFNDVITVYYVIVYDEIVQLFRRNANSYSSALIHSIDRKDFESDNEELMLTAHLAALELDPIMTKRKREAVRGTSDELESHNIELIKQGIETYNRIKLHPALLEKFLSSTKLKLNTEIK